MYFIVEIYWTITSVVTLNILMYITQLTLCGYISTHKQILNIRYVTLKVLMSISIWKAYNLAWSSLVNALIVQRLWTKYNTSLIKSLELPLNAKSNIQVTNVRVSYEPIDYTWSLSKRQIAEFFVIYMYTIRIVNRLAILGNQNSRGT